MIHKLNRLEQDMTNGGFIFFNSKKDKNNAYEILNQLFCFKKKIFDLKKYNNNSIFYKINLKSKNYLNEHDFKNREKHTIKSLVEILSGSENNIKNKDIAHFFLKNVSFIKTTGVHSPEGLILYENLEIFKKKKIIENHKIFNYICKYYHI